MNASSMAPGIVARLYSGGAGWAAAGSPSTGSIDGVSSIETMWVAPAATATSIGELSITPPSTNRWVKVWVATGLPAVSKRRDRVHRCGGKATGIDDEVTAARMTSASPPSGWAVK